MSKVLNYSPDSLESSVSMSTSLDMSEASDAFSQILHGQHMLTVQNVSIEWPMLKKTMFSRSQTLPAQNCRRCATAPWRRPRAIWTVLQLPG